MLHKLVLKSADNFPIFRAVKRIKMTVNARKYLLLLFICLVTLAANAQINLGNIKVQKISSENKKLVKGLSQNSIYCILQDSKGYMWFGTWDGLNMYDGYNFRVFKAGMTEAYAKLSNQTIQSLFEDNEGLIWVGTSKGINSYNRKTGKFNSKFSIGNNDQDLLKDTIWCINQDNKGYIWLGTNFGLLRLNKKGGGVSRIIHSDNDPNSLKDNSVLCIFKDNTGIFWIGSENGLDRFDPEKMKISSYTDVPEKNYSLKNIAVKSICEDDNGFIWVGTSKGLYKLHKENGIVEKYSVSEGNINGLSNDNISSLAFDPRNYLWIGTRGGGVNILDLNTQSFLFLNRDSKENVPSGNFISSIFIDHAGIVWVGTDFSGVSKVDIDAFRFVHFKKANDETGLNSEVAWGLCEDKQGKIWICTDAGMNIFDRKTLRFETLKKIPGNSNSLASNSARFAMCDSKGNIWIGTFDNGLDKYIPSEKRFIHYNIWSSETAKINSNTIWCVYECSKGYIWIGTNNGFHRLDPESNKIKTWVNDPENPKSLSNNTVFGVYEDESGILWLSTYKGVNKLDPKTGMIDRIVKGKAGKKSFELEGVFAVYKRCDGLFWFSTIGGGLVKYDPQKNLYQIYDEKNGLSNNVVYCTLDDGLGNLWLTTNYGVSKFNMKSETFLNYDAEDGIQSNEFNGGSYLITHDGYFVIGGMGGFNIFNPKNVRKNLKIPPIVITSVKVFNEEIPLEVNDGSVIELSYDQNFISFEFSALDFTNPVKNKYAYRLSGVDNDWKYCNAERRFAEYKQLDPGTYTLTIIGSNNDGVWNRDGISVTIIIEPPWWQSWTFRILFFGGLSIIVFFILYSRYLGLKRKHEMELKVLEIEKQLFDHEKMALRLQMNPHFIFNTLNSIQYFILQNDKLSSNRYLSMFSKLMRITLDNSQYNTISVQDELSALQLYVELESLRFEERFDFKFIIDKSLELPDIKIPSMILQPYVENAIKHGLMNKSARGMLTIEIKNDNNKLICIVEDDGVGREKARQIKEQRTQTHVSMGTRITESRLSLINSLYGSDLKIKYDDLKDAQGNAAGTRVTIYISLVKQSKKQ